MTMTLTELTDWTSTPKLSTVGDYCYEILVLEPYIHKN